MITLDLVRMGINKPLVLEIHIQFEIIDVFFMKTFKTVKNP